MVYGMLARDGRLVYCNAGHNPPMLFTRGRVERLEEGGLVLGPVRARPFAQATLRLEPGDVLVVFSDGVSEAIDRAGGRVRRRPHRVVHRRPPASRSGGVARTAARRRPPVQRGDPPARRCDRTGLAVHGGVDGDSRAIRTADRPSRPRTVDGGRSRVPPRPGTDNASAVRSNRTAGTSHCADATAPG